MSDEPPPVADLGPALTPDLAAAVRAGLDHVGAAATRFAAAAPWNDPDEAARHRDDDPTGDAVDGDDYYTHLTRDERLELLEYQVTCELPRGPHGALLSVKATGGHEQRSGPAEECGCYDWVLAGTTGRANESFPRPLVWSTLLARPEPPDSDQVARRIEDILRRQDRMSRWYETRPEVTPWERARTTSAAYEAYEFDAPYSAW